MYPGEMEAKEKINHRKRINLESPFERQQRGAGRVRVVRIRRRRRPSCSSARIATRLNWVSRARAATAAGSRASAARALLPGCARRFAPFVSERRLLPRGGW